MAAAAVDVALTMPDSSSSSAYDAGAASNLFSSGELEALDGFLASQLVAGSSTARTSASHPLTSVSQPASTSFLPSYKPPVFNGSSQHLPSVISTSGSNAFFAFPDSHETSAQREARLRNQADELASWFSRAQQAQGQNNQHYQASSNIACTSYSTQPPWAPTDYANTGSLPFGGRPSSASSTSNSESLSTPYGSFNATSIQATSFSSSHVPSLPLSRPLEHDSETSDSIHDQSFTQPPQAKRARTSFSVQEPEGVSMAIEAESKPTTARGRSKARSSSTASAAARKSKEASTTSRRRSSAAKAGPLKPDHGDASPSAKETSQAVSPVPAAASGSKSALTDEQKRANHILSEQKRRTAIRNAYDELCTIVPALKAAISEYNDRLSKIHGPAATTSAAASTSLEGGGPATVAGVLTGGIEVGGEKIDGRAGPKSEAVVLGKTVDYLTALLEDREDLLARLTELQKKAKDSSIAVGGSAASAPDAPWNKKWQSSNR